MKVAQISAVDFLRGMLGGFSSDIDLEREPFIEDSYKVLKLCEECKIDSFVSASSVTDIDYLVFWLPSLSGFTHGDTEENDRNEEEHMVKHIILWKLKEEYSKAQQEEIKLAIKEGLEGLKGQIPGLVDIKVYTEGLASSNMDLMLDSVFESEEALKNYAVHPAHVAVADGKVRPHTAIRSCMDFEA